MMEKVDAALVGNPNWWVFAPKICRKFLNQAVTLKLLFSKKNLEIEQGGAKAFEDLSAIYATLRMQFETCGLFYHLFIPSGNWEENILRFRLWELDGIRYRIKYAKNRNQTLSDSYLRDIHHLATVEEFVKNMPFYKLQEEKKRKFLLRKCAWRFTSASLEESNQNAWQISYDQLIRNTKIKKELYLDLYSQLSNHTHPSYVGVIQSYSLSNDEITIGKYSAIMFSCFVTAFLISDFAARFKESKEHLISLTTLEKEVINSLLEGSRNI
jgi:hypothetical protein